MRSRISASWPNAPSDTGWTAGCSWEELLRDVCEMLRDTPAELTRSATVCGHLKDGDEELLLLLAQVGGLSTEYGLASEVKLDGTAFSVIFARGGSSVRADGEKR